MCFVQWIESSSVKRSSFCLLCLGIPLGYGHITSYLSLRIAKDVEFIASLRVFPVTFACRSVTTCTASIFAIFASTSKKDQGVH